MSQPPALLDPIVATADSLGVTSGQLASPGCSPRAESRLFPVRSGAASIQE
ncbi:hypothetical protein ACIBCS_30370 [Streptomyces phaeochromogenes]|uniref:hypothetical protein n=1 Tax=Streptomyces phaeochromogenes TaxID=1923 RepID=UPI0033CDF325